MAMRLQFDKLQGFLDPQALTDENGRLAIEMASPDFWTASREGAIASTSKFDLNAKIIEAEKEIQTQLERIGETVGQGNYSEQDLEPELTSLQEKLTWLEAQTLFNGTYDEKDAYMFFHVGTGGVDAADFNQMLLDMYLQYAKNKDWQTEILQISENDEAGLKNAAIKISGFRAYGWLRSEAGVHRLIRISPFNAQGLRQTSFALVEVLPDLGDVDIEVKEEDLKIDTFKSSGHGGQSINTTDSAVRVTHIPTGIVVSIQTERSQTQNKEAALKILKQRLFMEEQQKRENKERSLKAATASGDFGQQIRTYTLHPYQQVKDHRSGFETAKTDDVLKGGKLDDVIVSVLTAQRSE
jgi:peptide chain release factor 2